VDGYFKLKVLFVYKKKYHRAIAIDKTKIKLENQWVYIWSAIDVDDPEYPSNPCFYNQNIPECDVLPQKGSGMP